MKLFRILGCIIIAAIAALMLFQLGSCSSLQKNKGKSRTKEASSSVKTYQGSTRTSGDTSAWMRLLDTSTKRSTDAWQKETWNIKFPPKPFAVADSGAMIIGPAAQRWWDSAHGAEFTYTLESGTRYTEEKAGKDSGAGKLGTYNASIDTSGNENVQHNKKTAEASVQVEKEKSGSGFVTGIGILALIALIIWGISKYMKAQLTIP